MNQPHPSQPGWAGSPAPGYGPPPAPPGQPYAQPGQGPPPGYAPNGGPPQAPPQAPPQGPQQAAPQGAPQAAPQGPQQGAPQGGGQSGMVLTLKYHPLAFILGLLTPVVTINGQPIQARWGRNELPMPAGNYQLHVHAPYLIPSRIGNADTIVPVSPGQIVDVEYRAPVWVFSPGTIGPPPQAYNGMGAMIAVWAACFVFVLLMIILIVVA